MKTNGWKLDTAIIHTAQEPCQKTGAVAAAVVPAVAYAFPDADSAAACVAGEREGTYYGRYGNPTIATLEQKIAALENGEAALGVSSGMAAISGALLAFCSRATMWCVHGTFTAGATNF